MNYLISALVLIISFSAHALNLTDYSVFTLNGIDASFADIQGAIGTTGNVELKHFQINATQAPTNFTIAASGKIDLDSVEAIQQNGSWRNIGQMFASHYRIVRSGNVGKRNTYSSYYPEVIAQFNRLNQTLRGGTLLNVKKPNFSSLFFNANQTSSSVAFFEITDSELARTREIQFQGRKEQTLIIRVLGQNISMQDIGMELIGVELGKVLFYFPEAINVQLTRSGYMGDLMRPVDQRTGVPASFFAPYACFNFTDGLITGSVYANSYDSLHNGQINFGLFSGDISCLNSTKGIKACSKVQSHSKNHQGQSQSK